MHQHHLFGSDLGATLANAARLWAHMFPHEYVRYLVAASLAYGLIHLLFARLLAGRKIRAAKPPAAQMVREFLTSTRTPMIFAFSGLLTIGGIELGLIHIYSSAGERGWFYFAFTVAALIVLHDAWFYWTHRLIHDPRLFRRFHRTHHKSMN
ncbi:MAG: sterol desaturase family protein, partial [Parvularculaceae bacterium]|nr:sterol desaturase family protein [Parvularculaceae bacterium]